MTIQFVDLVYEDGTRVTLSAAQLAEQFLAFLGGLRLEDFDGEATWVRCGLCSGTGIRTDGSFCQCQTGRDLRNQRHRGAGAFETIGGTDE